MAAGMGLLFIDALRKPRPPAGRHQRERRMGRALMAAAGWAAGLALTAAALPLIGSVMAWQAARHPASVKEVVQ
jgi:hypothetical protein